MADLSAMVQNLRLGANIPPPARLRDVREGFASIYVFETRPPNAGGAVVFRYDVEITDLGRDKSLTSGATDDGKKHLLRNICFELVNAVNKATQGFGSQALFVYDNRKNLFTNKPIQGDSLTYEVAPDHMTEHTRGFLRNAQVRVEIKPCQTESFELDLNDLGPSLCARPDQQSDHAVRTFLEMLTSQTFINAGTHDVIGMGRLFERKIVKRLEDGVVTRFGLAKGVRIIDNDGRPKAALVADVKTCAFFANETLARIVQDMMDKRRVDMNRKDQMERFNDDFNKIFRGVSGYLTYAPSRIIVIDSLSQRPMSEISLDVEGRRMSMVDFFAQKKNVRVDGRFPAVRQQQDRETLFPMECIVILPSQRIGIEKMSDFISRELLNANTTPPEHRYADIEAEVKRIGTGDSASFMNQFGVKLVGGRNTVKIGVHDPIKVKFSGLEAVFQDRINPAVRFLEPSNVLKDWVVAYPRSVRDNEARDFVEQVMRMGKSRGMNLPPPNYHGGIELDQLAERMQQLASNHVQFMLYIDRKFVKSHSILKLNEKRVGLLTQHVTLEVASKARAMTLSNVLNKMNMKLFGYNYMPILPPEVKNKFPMDAGDVLVIGVDTSRPPRCTGFEKYMMKKRGLEEGLQSEDPMIVGMCANYLKNPYKFCGDYYYQPCKQDVLEPNALLYKIGWVLQKVMHFRNKLPSIVVIIRDGVSEGMVPNNVHNEFPAYANACRVFNKNWNPKFVYCIVDKKHNKRFFVRGQNKIENTMPGHVIDSKVTRVDLHEFWLQSHVPLKGTSKIPQYMFPVNQINANNNELQGFLLAMCCNWQIVNLAPALPTPVRQASELAKRGRNNYMELKRTPQYIPRISGTQQIDYQALNNRLCYNGHTFANTRFNA